MMKFPSVVFPFLCAIILMTGCGGSNLPPDMPKPYPTTITITQDGQGLEDAAVTLLPQGGSTWYAGSRTNAQGAAQIMTQGQYPGAIPGKYKILVTKRYSDPSKITFPDPNVDPAGYTKAMEESAKNVEVLNSYNLIDPKYASAEATPEEIEIVAGSNTKTIDVGKAVKIKIEKK
jgi:hypothetical protein